MAQKKKQKKKDLTIKYPNLPTKERMARGGISIRSNVAQVDEPLRIDKLLRNGIIDEMQHLYGMQIITLWTIANRPFLKTSWYEPRISSGNMPAYEYINLSRMSAEDQFHKVMGFMRERDRGLICKICFDEMAAIEAGRQMKLPVNSITVYVRDAFDALGNALVKMRQLKKDLETPSEERECLSVDKV